MKNDKVHLLHNMLMHLCYRRKKNLECWKKKHTKTYWWGLCFISPSVKIYGFSFIASVADSPHMHHVKPVIICISCCDRCYLMYTQGWCGWTVRCHTLFICVISNDRAAWLRFDFHFFLAITAPPVADLRMMCRSPHLFACCLLHECMSWHHGGVHQAICGKTDNKEDTNCNCNATWLV